MARTLRQRLGQGLREQRELWGLSQDALAYLVGLTPRYLAGLERGERNLTLNTVDKIAFILGVDPVNLLTGQLSDQLPERRDPPSNANPVQHRNPRATSRAPLYDDTPDPAPDLD